MRVISSVSRRFLRRLVGVVLAITLLIIAGDKLLGYVSKLLYPNNYSEYVEKYSTEFEVDTALTFAMIKCESNFNQNAESSAGAIGLMQLTPETFSWVCKNIYDFEVDSNLIYDPATNIKCGVWLISYLKGELYSEREVIAAYNAGVNKVKEWLQNPEYSKDGKVLEKAPYKETDNHIKKVQRAKDIYIKLYYNEE